MSPDVGVVRWFLVGWLLLLGSMYVVGGLLLQREFPWDRKGNVLFGSFGLLFFGFAIAVGVWFR